MKYMVDSRVLFFVFATFGFFGGDVLEGVPTLTTCRDSCLLRSWPGGASFFLAPGLLLGEAITQKHLENWGYLCYS